MLKMEQSGSLWIAISATVRNQNWYSNEIMLKSYKRSDMYFAKFAMFLHSNTVGLQKTTVFFCFKQFRLKSEMNES